MKINLTQKQLGYLGYLVGLDLGKDLSALEQAFNDSAFVAKTIISGSNEMEGLFENAKTSLTVFEKIVTADKRNKSKAPVLAEIADNWETHHKMRTAYESTKQKLYDSISRRV